MSRRWIGSLLLAASVGLTACVRDLISELKEDAAIVGSTGLYTSIGFDPSPATGMLPLPHIKFGHGTAFRVGIHDCVYVSNAAGARAYVNASPSSLDGGAGSGTLSGTVGAGQGRPADAGEKGKLAADAAEKAKAAVTAAEAAKAEVGTPKEIEKVTESTSKMRVAADAAEKLQEAVGTGKTDKRQADCIPVPSQVGGPAASGAGAGGEAYLTISGSGLETLKERWKSDPTKRSEAISRVMDLLKNNKISPEQATNLINAINPRP